MKLTFSVIDNPEVGVLLKILKPAGLKADEVVGRATMSFVGDSGECIVAPGKVYDRLGDLSTVSKPAGPKESALDMQWKEFAIRVAQAEVKVTHDLEGLVWQPLHAGLEAKTFLAGGQKPTLADWLLFSILLSHISGMVPLVGKRCYRVVRWANYLGALGRKASGDTGLFRAADVAACEAEMKGLALHNGTLKPAASSAAPAEPKKKPQKIPQAPQAPAAPATDLHPFARIDLRVGRIVSVERHPAADRLYVEQVDLGEESGPRTVVSGLVDHVPLEALQNRLAVFICNLKPATLCKVVSSAMLLVSKDEKTGVLEPLVVPEGGKAGDRISIAGVTPQPDAAIKPKEDTWERVKADLRTVNGVAHWKDCRLLVNGLADSTGHITSTAVPNGTIS